MFNNKQDKEIMWWECPKCGWNPSDITGMDSPELFYYIENNKAVPLREGWVEITDPITLVIHWEFNIKLFRKIMKEKGLGIYPKRINGSSFFDPWSGASGSAWTEIHKCPNCNEEFEFSNSSI